MTKFLNISTDNTLGGNSASDELVSSQKATKDYIDSLSVDSLSDTDVSNPTDGDVLTYNSTNSEWVASSPSGGTWGSITGTLSNQTDLQNALDNKEPLIYKQDSAPSNPSNGALWIDTDADPAPYSAPTNLSDLDDTDITNPSNGQVLTYDSTTSKWENAAIPSELPSQTGQSGKYLTTDGSNLSWAAVSSGSSSLSGLTDTTITTPTDGQVLTYDNSTSKWINANSGVSSKADKVSNATNGNLAGLNASGNLTDSGISATSVSTAVTNSHTHANKTYLDKIPSSTGSNGDVLTSNGTTWSWASPFPSQTNQEGKVLTTNGSSVSWQPTAKIETCFDVVVDYESVYYAEIAHRFELQDYSKSTYTEDLLIFVQIPWEQQHFDRSWGYCVKSNVPDISFNDIYYPIVICSETEEFGQIVKYWELYRGELNFGDIAILKWVDQLDNNVEWRREDPWNPQFANSGFELVEVISSKQISLEFWRSFIEPQLRWDASMYQDVPTLDIFCDPYQRQYLTTDNYDNNSDVYLNINFSGDTESYLLFDNSQGMQTCYLNIFTPDYGPEPVQPGHETRYILPQNFYVDAGEIAEFKFVKATVRVDTMAPGYPNEFRDAIVITKLTIR